jgi:probable HAF family extracellular repeat protein
MQSSTANYVLRSACWKRRLLLSLVALATAASAVPASPAANATKTSYRVVQLSAFTGNAAINAKGQVAFTELVQGATRAKFYDGKMVRDIGTLGGSYARIAAINDLGQIAGTSSLRGAGQVLHAFRWSKETGMTDLAAVGTGNSSATDINNRGLVTGTAEFRRGTHAFRWAPAYGMWDMVSVNNRTLGNAFNDRGDIVGTAEPRPGAGQQAMAWTMWGVMPIKPFSTMYSTSHDINNAGQIVGSAAFGEGGKEVAFLARAYYGTIDLGVPGPTRASADKINEGGVVIGSSVAPGGTRGFVWSGEHGLKVFGRIGLDRTSTVALNNLDQVVGGFNGRAFVWTHQGGVVDLNTRMYGAPPGLVLREGIAISDNGSIVATTNNGLALLIPDSSGSPVPDINPIKITGTLRTNVTLSLVANIKNLDLRAARKAVWTWGDGSQATIFIDEKTSPRSFSEQQYAYPRNGNYTVRLTFTDSSFKEIVTIQRNIVISPSGAFIDG